MKYLLVVDDQAEIGDYIKNVAEPLGYNVTVTDDSARFISLYKMIEPDIVVLDVFMPGRDGIELVRELAALHCAARVLFISGADGFFLDSIRRLAGDVGLANVTALKKPLRLHDLRAFLGEAPGAAKTA